MAPSIISVWQPCCPSRSFESEDQGLRCSWTEVYPAGWHSLKKGAYHTEACVVSESYIICCQAGRLSCDTVRARQSCQKQTCPRGMHVHVS